MSSSAAPPPRDGATASTAGGHKLESPLSLERSDRDKAIAKLERESQRERPFVELSAASPHDELQQRDRKEMLLELARTRQLSSEEREALANEVAKEIKSNRTSLLRPSTAGQPVSEVAQRNPQETEAVIRAQMDELGKTLESLPKGNIVLNAPAHMVVGDQREVRANVGYNVPIEKLRQELGKSSQQVQGSLRLSTEMAATLTGPGFKIDGLTSESQAVAAGFPTVWKWNVTAKQDGDEELEATLYAVILRGDKITRLRVESYTQKITVNVQPRTWGEWLTSVSEEVGNVKTVLLAVSGLVTGGLAWLGISWRWWPTAKPKRSLVRAAKKTQKARSPA